MKKIALFALVTGLIVTGLSACKHPTPQDESTFTNGVNLDIARKFYGPRAIERLIDQVSEGGGSYVQLHLSDDENVAIELDTLGQTTENSQLKDGVHYHEQTGRPFLSKAELADLVAYANDRDVRLVPDFDTPGHFTAAAELLRVHDADLAERVLTEDQLAYDSPEGLAFAKDLYGELAEIFADQGAMVIGGDEFDGDQDASNPAYVAYVNELSSYLADEGFETRIWNDTVLKDDLEEFDRENLQVIYWSLNGDANDSSSEWDREANEYRVENRATLPELQVAGFEVINANSYYLYSVPDQSDVADLQQSLAEDADQTLSNWQPNLWNGTDHPTDQAPTHRSSTTHLRGSLYSVWGEDLDGVDDEDVVRAYGPTIETFLEQAKR